MATRQLPQWWSFPSNLYQPIRGKGERSQRQPQNTRLLCSAGVWLHVLVSISTWLHR